MLAAAKGELDALDLLLATGANPGLRDNFGTTALLEACKQGHDPIIARLMASNAKLGDNRMRSTLRNQSAAAAAAVGAGALLGGGSGAGSSAAGASRAQQASSDAAAVVGPLGLKPLEAASMLCNAVYECNAPLLRRLIAAGAPVDAGDYVSGPGCCGGGWGQACLLYPAAYLSSAPSPLCGPFNSLSTSGPAHAAAHCGR